METSQLTGLLTSLTGRYAKTLHDIALEQENTTEITKQFNEFIIFLNANKDLEDTLLSPSLTREEHSAIFAELGKKLKINPLLQQFFHILAENRRLDYLKEIQAVYQLIVNEQGNTHTAEVVSAHTLTAAQKKQITSILESQSQGTLSLSFATDPKLLGGFYVRDAKRVLDLTFANQLKKLTNIMKGKA